MIQFDLQYIFQMGWFNHQPVVELSQMFRLKIDSIKEGTIRCFISPGELRRFSKTVLTHRNKGRWAPSFLAHQRNSQEQVSQ